KDGYQVVGRYPHSGVDQPGTPTCGAVPDRRSLQHDRTRSTLSEMQCGRQARKPGANDGNIYREIAIQSQRLRWRRRSFPPQAVRAIALQLRLTRGALPRDHANSKTASTSTLTPRGNTATPTAERACLPASPKTCTITSEAPLATFG